MIFIETIVMVMIQLHQCISITIIPIPTIYRYYDVTTHTIIDVSQSVELSHPFANDFLKKDIRSVGRLKEER